MPDIVEFHLRDIIHPCPVEVLRTLYADNRLQGEVLAVTDDGQEPASFVVVKVSGLCEPVIVPARKVSSQPVIK